MKYLNINFIGAVITGLFTCYVANWICISKAGIMKYKLSKLIVRIDRAIYKIGNKIF